jgi:hypothetical protein
MLQGAGRASGRTGGRRKHRYRRNVDGHEGWEGFAAVVEKSEARKAEAKALAKAKATAKRARAAAKRLRAETKKLRARAKRSGTRLYGRRYVAAKARIGARSRGTYLYRTKKGAYRHIPEHGVLGYPTAREMKKAAAAGDARYTKAKSKLDARRRRDAERASKVILGGRGLFSPNRRGRVLTFEEWKKMKRNPKNPTKKQSAASRRNLKKARTALARKRGKGKARVTRTAAAKKTKASTRKKPSPVGKKISAAKRAKMTKGLRAYHAACKAALKRKGKGKVRPNEPRYRKNAAGDYTENLVGALKIGTIVLAGYVAHRALTKLLNEQALAKIEFLNKGEVANWRKTIASAIVAAIGVPVIVKAMPKDSAAGGAGIAVSFLHGLLIDVLTAAKAENVAGYLAAYPDDEGSVYYGSGLGSYYTYGPGQVFNGTKGFGEFYQTQPGQLTYGQLTQAAAGMGQVPRLQQAAAGMRGTGEYLTQGNESAMVTQAAAGEYLAYGARGVGAAYEQIPVRGRPMSIYDEGAPNMRAAEQALNVVEAAAGVGSAEVPYEASFDPTLNAVDIPNGPGDSRGGIFGTPGGIFGGSAM